eukprot:m51a1_g1349 hypothetical protein (497) ;mRNA; f:349174-350787
MRMAEPALDTASLLLRTAVPDLVARGPSYARDLAALSLSMPRVLCGPCVAPLPRGSAAAAALSLVAESAARNDPRGLRALLGAPRLAGALGGDPWAAGGCGVVARWVVLASLSAAQGSEEIRGILESEPFRISARRESPGKQGASPTPEYERLVDYVPGDLQSIAHALRVASAAGMYSVVDLLARAPFRAGSSDARAFDCACLREACAGGHAAVVRSLARKPYSLGSPDVAPLLRDNALFASALAASHTELILALAEPPYSLPPDFARWDECRALRTACSRGDVRLLRALGRPPFGLGRDEALIGCAYALQAACAGGHAEAVRELARHPWGLGAAEARVFDAAPLRMACASGSVETVRVLGSRPYSLGAADARKDSGGALREACEGGRDAVVRELGRPPWCLGRADARARDGECVRAAASRGHARVLEVLASEPYNTSMSDVEAARAQQDRAATAGGHKQPPTTNARPAPLDGQSKAAPTPGDSGTHKHSRVCSLL